MFEKKFLTQDGRFISAVCYGTQDFSSATLKIVCLHGWLDNASTFDLLIPNQPVDQLPKFHDLGNGKITEFRSFCDSAKSDDYFKKLLQTCPCSHDSIKIAGKTIPILRLQCWMGDPGAIYAYSGINLAHNAWSPIVLELKTIAENLSSSKLNSVLINRYRNGLDSVSWHADDEKELGDDPVIV